MRPTEPDAIQQAADMPTADARGVDASLAGQRVLVAGLGESGLAMARWCARQGAAVTVVDSRAAPPGLAALRAELPQARFVAAGLSTEAAAALLAEVDRVAWSPGLSPLAGDAAALHQAARQRGLPVEGELTLFARALARLRAARGYAPAVVAITGTNGKTTTTRLTGHLLQAAGRRVAVAGNVAPAALDALREALAHDDLPDAWVLELSSFQLALAEGFEPDAATVLNVTQDHLDWHGTMQAYAAAKRRVYGARTVCVHNRDDAATAAPRKARAVSFGLDAPRAPGDLGVVRDGALDWLAEALGPEAGGRRRRGEPAELRINRLMPAAALRIRGRHNQANALAALALARAIGLPLAPLLHALRDYAGEPHRCEPVAVVGDVEWIDDSKGTNVGATVAALDGLDRRAVLIAGGDGKGQDFSALAAPVARAARAVLLIGRDAAAIEAAVAGSGVPVERCASLDEAVARAAALARAGDAVLLSPACASFDMFRSYVHRAETFVAAVRRLADEAGQPC